MKKLNLLVAALFFVTAIFAQNVKKYVLLEHFTNTNCGTCKARNPGLYTNIAPYAADVHHISFHPSIPYSSCVLYQQNTTENDSRTNFYGVDGTPRAVLNGVQVPISSQLLPTAALQAVLGQTSPLQVKVTEVLGNSRVANVTLKSVATPPTAAVKLHVAVVEKTLNLATANGETVHRDVFRKFLTPVSGQNIMLPAAGASSDFSFPYTLQNGWNAAEIYVVVWVQRTDNKEVINSGTRFDVTTNLDDLADSAENLFEVSPNPSFNSDCQIAVGNWNDVSIFDAQGKLVQTANLQPFSSERLKIAALPAGIYWLQAKRADKNKTIKFVKN